MNRWQEQVREFHEAMDQPHPDKLLDEWPEETRRLRAKLIAEEAAETCAALGYDVSFLLWDPTRDTLSSLALIGAYTPEAKLDQLEAIDGLCDLLYVTVGSGVALGVDLEPHFDEVQRANMLKASGPVREDGKRLKPAGWTPPDHAPILAAQRSAS